MELASVLDGLRKVDRRAQVLDLGCGYGTHLAAAAERAAGPMFRRGTVGSRPRRGPAAAWANAAYIVQSVSDLVPHGSIWC